jgi:hypothetical protein
MMTFVLNNNKGKIILIKLRSNLRGKTTISNETILKIFTGISNDLFRKEGYFEFNIESHFLASYTVTMLGTEVGNLIK